MLKVAGVMDIPAGAPVMAKSTWLLKPLVPETETFTLADAPGTSATLLGSTATEKSGGGGGGLLPPPPPPPPEEPQPVKVTIARVANKSPVKRFTSPIWKS